MEQRWWMAGSFMIRYSPRGVGAGPRAYPVGIYRDGGQTGRKRGAAPTELYGTSAPEPHTMPGCPPIFPSTFLCPASRPTPLKSQLLPL